MIIRRLGMFFPSIGYLLVRDSLTISTGESTVVAYMIQDKEAGTVRVIP